MNALQAIQRAARENGIADWRALAAVGNAESGLNPSNIGDGGTSFGLFQLHQGGALGNMSTSQARQYLDAYKNASFAARQIKAMGAHGLTGHDAINAFVTRFERPANPSAEVARAWAWYQNQGKGLAASSPTSPTSSASMTTPASSSTSPTGQSTLPMQNLINSNAKMFHLPTIHLPAFAPTQLGISAVPDGITPQQMPHPSSIGSAITNAAKQFLGIKYTWGGTSPKTGFDCSGLVQYVFHKFGINTPRVSEAQFLGGAKISQAQARSGDLVFFRHANGDVGHVGIYLGNGQMINAPHTGDVVRIASIAGRNIAGFRRYAR